jgi:hypothetical protein
VAFRHALARKQRVDARMLGVVPRLGAMFIDSGLIAPAFGEKKVRPSPPIGSDTPCAGSRRPAGFPGSSRAGARETGPVLGRDLEFDDDGDFLPIFAHASSCQMPPLPRRSLPRRGDMTVGPGRPDRRRIDRLVALQAVGKLHGAVDHRAVEVDRGGKGRDHTSSPAEQDFIAEMLATVARLGGAAPDRAQTMSARAKAANPRASAQAGAISS